MMKILAILSRLISYENRRVRFSKRAQKIRLFEKNYAMITFIITTWQKNGNQRLAN